MMDGSSNTVQDNGTTAGEELSIPSENSLEDHEAEVERYEHALMTLIDMIRCSDPDQIQTLLKFLRNKDTVAEAMEEVLQLKFLSGAESG